MNKKKQCPECGVTYTLHCFKYNPIKDKKLCGRCHNKIGTNKFYFPEIKGEKRFNKHNNYDLTLNEKQALFKELISQGINEDVAKKRVNNRCRYVRQFQWRKRRENKDEGNVDIMKNLLAGLKQ